MRRANSFEGFALEADGAEAEPVADGHLFDEDLFGLGGGLVIGDEGVEEGFELLGVFAGDEGGAGGEAVREAIAGGFGFALRGLGWRD